MTSPVNEDIHNTELTVGLVQKDIYVGMQSTDVIRILGSPNIVKKASGEGETWVYDKFSTEQITQSIGGILTVLTNPVGGAIMGGVSRNRNSSAVLTVIIRFDEQNQVVDLAYHRSRF
jgi:outer membrane protein assembly factor BamE (lipoprotein component of BamABCDE complex)